MKTRQEIWQENIFRFTVRHIVDTVKVLSALLVIHVLTTAFDYL